MLLVSLSVSWTINPIVSLLLLLGKLSLLAKRQLRKYSWRWNRQYQMLLKILWLEWYNTNTGRCIACRFSIMAYWDALSLDPHLRFQLKINTRWSKMVIQIYNIQLCVIYYLLFRPIVSMCSPKRWPIFLGPTSVLLWECSSSNPVILNTRVSTLRAVIPIVSRHWSLAVVSPLYGLGPPPAAYRQRSYNIETMHSYTFPM